MHFFRLLYILNNLISINTKFIISDLEELFARIITRKSQCFGIWQRISSL